MQYDRLGDVGDWFPLDGDEEGDDIEFGGEVWTGRHTEPTALLATALAKATRGCLYAKSAVFSMMNRSVSDG